MNKYFTESEVMTQDFLDWLESRHLKLRTTNEVRAAWFGWKAAHDRLLEAREKAVPVMVVNHVSSAEHDLPIGMKLYTHPAPSDADALAFGEALHRVVEAALAAHSAQAQPADNELPGMWSHSDFVGGDPDERSYAERQAQPPAASVTDAMVGRAWMALTGRAGKRGYEKDYECMMDVERKSVRAALEAALAAQENPNG